MALGQETVRWNTETLARHLRLPTGRLETHLTIPLFHAFGLVLGLFMTHLRGGRWHVPRRSVGIMEAVLAGPALTHTSGEMPEEDSAIGLPLPGVELIPPTGGPGAGSGWMFRSPGAASAILPAGSHTWQRVEQDEAIPTGDLLERAAHAAGDRDGYRFLGRTAWTFKKKGETLSPVWIEEAIWTLLREGAPAPERTRRIEAAIRRLPTFVRPDRILWVPHFPRNALGKVERGELGYG